MIIRTEAAFYAPAALPWEDGRAARAFGTRVLKDGLKEGTIRSARNSEGTSVSKRVSARSTKLKFSEIVS